MLALKWLAGANITTFACGEISFARRLPVPMTRGLSHGWPLFEARSPLGHSFGRGFVGDVAATFRHRIMRYHTIEKEPCCASQQNWPANVRFVGHKRTNITAEAMSALPSKADIERHDWHVRFVPIAS